MQALGVLTRLPYWEIWVPIVIGMVAGCLSIMAFRTLLGGGARIKSVPRPAPKVRDYDPYVPNPSELRRSLRRDGNPVEIYVAPDQSNEPTWRAWVVDRSTGGVCLSTTDEFPAGTILRIMPSKAPAMTPWTDICLGTGFKWNR
ncbi:MAG: hypothetical protein FJ271_26345 [Planctomycetes bacterium]|nr:hypothetical protein [Planctomycetota bacterium]